MVQQPKELNRHYFDLFATTLKGNIPEYDRVEKRFIAPVGIVETISAFDLSGGTVVGSTQAGRWSDYVRFGQELSLDKIDFEVEVVARQLAVRLAGSVEALIAETAVYGMPICYDLFKLADGSPNLRTFYCVKGDEATLDDPTGSITGWFSYRVQFLVDTRP